MAELTEAELEPMRELWVLEGSDSDLGLWWIAEDIRERLGTDASEVDVRKATLKAIWPLLESGRLMAANLTEFGVATYWTESIDEQLERIDREWAALGRKPTIADVVWFLGRRPA